MKVLVVEDSIEKKIEILALLRKYGLDNYCIDDNARDGYYSATDDEYDLFICDMDIPKNGSFPIIDDELEGLNLIKELMRSDIKIPTIIYSPLEIAEAKINHLKDSGYPLIGHAKDSSQVDEYMEERFFAQDETLEDYFALAKVIPRFRKKNQE